MRTIFLVVGACSATSQTDTCRDADETALLQGRSQVRIQRSRMTGSEVLQSVRDVANSLTEGTDSTMTPEDVSAALDQANDALATMAPALRRQVEQAQEQVVNAVGAVEACHLQHGGRVREHLQQAVTRRVAAKNDCEAELETLIQAEAEVCEGQDDDPNCLCTEAREAVTDQTTLCVSVIETYEAVFCEHDLVCTMLHQCHVDESEVYNTLRAGVEAEMVSLRQEYVTYEQVQCITGLIQEAMRTLAPIPHASLLACDDVDVSGLVVSYPELPTAPTECPSPEDAPRCDDDEAPPAPAPEPVSCLATLLSGSVHCPECTCEVSASDPAWRNSGCQSMFDDVLTWGAGPGLHLRNDASLTLTFPEPVSVDHIVLQQIHGHGHSYHRGDFSIETFHDGAWTVQAHVDDLPVAQLPMEGDGRFVFQLSSPVTVTGVRMSAGNPQQGNGEIFRLEELQVYGCPLPLETPVQAQESDWPATLLSGNAHCPTCNCELSASDPHWGNSNCHSMFDDDLRWGAGPGLHLRNGAAVSVTFPEPVLVDHIDLQQIQNHGSAYLRGDFSIETFNDGAWRARFHVDDLPANELPMESQGRFAFQFSAPLTTTGVRMVAGNPRRGGGEIFRLEELQVYGWPNRAPEPVRIQEVPSTPSALLSGNAQCPGCTCEVSASDPHWRNSNCRSMFDDVLRWGAGPGLHLRNGASLTVTFPQPVFVDHIDLQQIQNHGNAYFRGDFSMETFDDGVWRLEGQVDDLPVAQLPMSNGRFIIQLAEPVRATKVRMLAGNPYNGAGEIFRLEELQVYGWAS